MLLRFCFAPTAGDLLPVIDVDGDQRAASFHVLLVLPPQESVGVGTKPGSPTGIDVEYKIKPIMSGFQPK